LIKGNFHGNQEFDTKKLMQLGFSHVFSRAWIFHQLVLSQNGCREAAQKNCTLGPSATSVSSPLGETRDTYSAVAPFPAPKLRFNG
jgi:hypothetical protein